VIFFNETTIIEANQSALDLFEVTLEEFIGHEIYEFTLDKENIIERVKQRLEGVSGFFTTKIHTPTGVKELEVSLSPATVEKITSYSIVRAITGRKRLEQRYRIIFEYSQDLIFITSKNVLEFINPHGVEYLGYSSPDEIIGRHPTMLIHPDYRELVTKYATMRRAGDTPPNQYRAKMITKDGESKPVEFNSSYIEWDGKPASLTIARDISKQVELEEELIQSQETLHEFIEASTDAFIILDDDMRFIMVNETELRYSGLKREGYLGKHLLEVFPDLEDSERYSDYHKVLEIGEAIHFPDVTSRSGKYRITYTAFKAGDYLGIVGRDVTAEKEYERQMQEYQNKLSIFYSYSARLEDVDSVNECFRLTYEAIREAIDADYWEVRRVETNQTVIVFPQGDPYPIKLNEETIINRTIKEKKTQLLGDAPIYPDFFDSKPSNPIRSCIMVPILYDANVLGLINVESSQVNAFNHEDREMLETFAYAVGIVIQNIKYKNSLEALHDFSFRLAYYDSLDDIAEETLRTVDTVLDFPFSSFGVIRDNVLWFPYAHGGEPNAGFYLPLEGPGITVRAVRTGETQVVNDVTLDPDYVDPEVDLGLGKSELVVPVFEHDKPVGVIVVDTRDVIEFRPEAVNLLALLGDIVSARLTSIKVEEERIRAEKAMEMEEVKSRFMRTATHELRTPLTSMKGFLELALSEEDPDKAKEYLAIATRNTERLVVLTNDLLDQQRLEGGRMSLDLEAVNLDRVVSQVVTDLGRVLGEKSQRVEVEMPENVVVMVDEMRFEQVLVNLLDNASKYSPEGSTIQVSGKFIDGEVLVSVSDMGIGLAEADLEKLFKPFPDIDHPVVSEQSVGLGLSICKGIIDMHGGEIWVESPGPGEGSTFIFTIPRRRGKDEYNTGCG
jgi:PAS domain S-box-containing protein